MAKLESYITVGRDRLRCGYTTGSCAALAAQGAARALLLGQQPETARILTPKGIAVEVELLEWKIEPDRVSCAVVKDGGEDVDATDGALIFASVERTEKPGIEIDGGEGVGRVTKPGLEQPVGAAAINRVPRQMIAAELEAVCAQAGYTGGLRATVSVPRGREIAARTFNPNLGIVGGISILGTTGIVEPRSLRALCDSIRVEMRQIAANASGDLIITPGNYGADFIAQYPRLRDVPVEQCANFIGSALDFAAEFGFRRVLLVGHIGKFIKLAGGITDTHSRTADCRMEIFAAHAALLGAPRSDIQQIMQAVTTDDCLDIAERGGYLKEILPALIEKAQWHAARRAAGSFEVGVVMFSNKRGVLGASEQAEKIIRAMEEER